MECNAFRVGAGLLMEGICEVIIHANLVTRIIGVKEKGQEAQIVGGVLSSLDKPRDPVPLPPVQRNVCQQMAPQGRANFPPRL